MNHGSKRTTRLHHRAGETDVGEAASAETAARLGAANELLEDLGDLCRFVQEHQALAHEHIVDLLRLQQHVHEHAEHLGGRRSGPRA